MPDDQSSYLAPVPEAIRRQSELADQIARDAGITNVPAAKSTTVVEAEPLPATSDQVQEASQDEAQEPAQAQPELPLGDAPAPARPADPDWQQRYNSLQGKYNSEVPELQAQVRSMERIIAGMQRSSHASEQTRQETRQTPQHPPFAELEIDPADKEAYGEELITKAQRWAEAKLAPRFAQLESRLASYEGRTQQIAQQSAATSVEGQLDRAVPNWRDVNIDPQFNVWLGQADPFSGLSRKQLITDAHVSGDAPRTIAFFQAFLREQTAVNPGTGTQMVQTAASPPANGAMPAADRLPLESLAAPGRGAATPAAPGAPAARIWTQAQIQQLYREKVRGQWDGREADFFRLEQDISAAAREGRYRQ